MRRECREKARTPIEDGVLGKPSEHMLMAFTAFLAAHRNGARDGLGDGFRIIGVDQQRALAKL